MNVKILDYDRVSATLAWQAPLKDGGVPINGYYIECLKIPGKASVQSKPDWARVNLQPISQCQFKAPGLREDIEYRYIGQCLPAFV